MIENETSLEILHNTHIACLRKNELDNNLHISYEPIIKNAEDELSDFTNYLNELSDDDIDNRRLNPDEFLRLYNKHKTIITGQQNINYCKSLYESYQDISLKERYTKRIHLYIEENTLHNDLPRVFNGFSRFIKNREFALRFNQTLELLGRNSINIISSHQHHGWKTKFYELDSNFNFKIDTNFGYGYVSYFHLTINFKGIQIIPFTDFIFYINAMSYDVLRYSYKPEIYTGPENWIQVYNYIIDAIKIYNQDSNLFIKTYILKECEDLVKKTKEILTTDNFTLKQLRNDRKTQSRFYSDLPFTDFTERNLVRSEKITGTLSFISSINKYRNLIDIAPYINQIEAYNRTLHPLIIEESTRLKQKITKEKMVLKSLNRKAEILNKKVSPLEHTYKRLKKESSDQLNAFLSRNKQFTKNIYELMSLNNRIGDLRILIDKLTYYLKQYDKFMNTYKNYFDH